MGHVDICKIRLIRGEARGEKCYGAFNYELMMGMERSAIKERGVMGKFRRNEHLFPFQF